MADRDLSDGEINHDYIIYKKHGVTLGDIAKHMGFGEERSGRNNQPIPRRWFEIGLFDGKGNRIQQLRWVSQNFVGQLEEFGYIELRTGDDAVVFETHGDADRKHDEEEYQKSKGVSDEC